jgi:hypothetical protein
MGKPMSISAVAGGLTLERYAELADADARMAAVRAREQASIRGTPPSPSGGKVGRPEYLSLEHALRKERMYADAVWRGELARRRREGIMNRWEERERRKAARVMAWLDFDPEAVAVELSNLPSF